MNAITDPNNKVCVTAENCPTTPATYADVLERACIACHADCKTCFGPSNKTCIECNLPKYTFSGRCFSDPASCPNGSWGNESNKVCEPCDVACMVCTDGTATSCSQCTYGYFLEDGTNCV